MMISDEIVALLLGAVLLYKTVDFFVLREKVMQACLRGLRLSSGTKAFGSRWGKIVTWLAEEFPALTLVYFLAIFLLLGALYIVGESQGVNYIGAKVVSGVTIFSSTIQSMMSMAVERYRTLLETS